MVLVKDITEMVKGNAMSEFARFFDGKLVYRIFNPKDEKWYCYDIPVEEAKGASFFAKEKSIFHIRWIRKAISTNQFRLVMNQ